VVTRPTNQYYFSSKNWVEKPSGIYPALNWIDYSDEEKGLTIINRGLPAHEIRDGNIYLTLLRSVEMLSSDGVTGPAVPTPDAQEFKNYSFYYSLFPHQKNWKESNCFKPAQEFNNDLIGFQLPLIEKGRKTLPSQCSFLEIKPKSLILTAFKKAEDSGEIILRLFETKGEKTQGEINLFKEPQAVEAVNLLEEKGNESEKIKIGNKKIRLEVKPFEIITLKINFKQ
jgi:alpha-mannosidase